jgi:hypothetical protein
VLNEVELRTPEFTEGCRIKLADGQEWSFPRPHFRFWPSRDASGKIVVSARNTFDDEYRQLFMDYMNADRDDAYAMWTLKLQIACHLLLCNYAIPDDALGELLPVDFENETNQEMWMELGPILMGQLPKPLTDGLNTP